MTALTHVRSIDENGIETLINVVGRSLTIPKVKISTENGDKILENVLVIGEPSIRSKIISNTFIWLFTALLSAALLTEIIRSF